jgi:hypothetical protein
VNSGTSFPSWTSAVRIRSPAFITLFQMMV